MASTPSIANSFSDHLIHSTAQPDCIVCGTSGDSFYKDLTDRFFGASGRWDFLRCPNPQCGMLWLNPMPLERDIWKAYLNYYTHDDDGGAKGRPSSRSLGRAARQKIKDAYIATRLHHIDRDVSRRERMLGALAYLDPTRRADTDFPVKYLARETRGRLLDLGCGSGDLLGRMRSFGWQVEGLDVDPAAVEAARRRGFKVRIGSLHEQKFSDAGFDAVVMSHVIEHVHWPRELLTEVRRILKPGRRLVIATPNARSLGHRLLGSRWPFLDPPRHLQVFTPRALESLVLAAGFCEPRISTEIRTAAAMLPLVEAGRSDEALLPTLTHPRFVTRIAGRALEYGENLALHLDRNAGEEIALVAVR
jgi:2-polyprenyl-3-methyl-5-hydroxy-6-metoxy-1,4-benzoquinol methylase